MKRHLTAIMALVLIISMFAACGNGGSSASENAEPDDASQTVESSATTAQTSETEEPEDVQEDDNGIHVNQLPLVDELTTLTFYNSWNPSNPSITQSMDDYLAIQEAEKLTNVHIDWTMVAAASFGEQFNVMVASDEYCDIMGFVNSNYVGGIAGALNDEVIINIKSYLADYAPNYSARIDDIEYGWAQVSLDDDTVGAIYSLDDTSLAAGTRGLAIRGDWLKALGLETPETYEEFHDVFTAMKTEYGCYGFCLSGQIIEWGYPFVGGYGTPGYSLSFFGSDSYWYQVDGTVKNALIEDGFKKYLETMHQYYEEGLISPDFMTVAEQPNDPDKIGDMANGVYASFGISYGNIDTILANSTDENIEILAVKGPVENKGDKVHFCDYMPIMTNALESSISSACENPELAIAWLDFWYSETGYMLYDAGVEGTTYEIRDGVVYYTDLIVNNEYDLPIENASQLYCPAGMISSYRFVVTSSYPQASLDAINVWSEGFDHEYVMPVMTLSLDEIEEYNNGLADLQTFAKECIPAFINGSKSLDEWDSYVETLKSLGIEEKIAIYQNVLDRMK